MKKEQRKHLVLFIFFGVILILADHQCMRLLDLKNVLVYFCLLGSFIYKGFQFYKSDEE